MITLGELRVLFETSFRFIHEIIILFVISGVQEEK